MTPACLAVLLLTLSASLPQDGQGGDPEALWQGGQRLAALDLWQEQLARRPDDRALRQRLAQGLLTVHRYAAALEVAEDTDPPLSHTVARAHYLLGHYEECLGWLDPDDPLEAVMLVDAHEVLGHVDATREALDRAEAVLGPEHVDLLAARGRLLAREGRPAEAEACFRAVLDQDEDHMGALFGLGQALIRQGQREAGLELLALHRERTPLVDALDFARRAVDLGPAHAANHAVLGDALRAMGRHDRARTAYERAVTLSGPGELVPVVLRLARLLHEDLGDVDGAVAALDGAWARLPDPRLAVRAGDILAAAGQLGDAAARYDAVLALRPGDAAVRARRDALGLDDEEPPP